MLLRNLKEVQHRDQNKGRDRDARKALLEASRIVTSGSRNGLCFIPHAQALGLLANRWGQIWVHWLSWHFIASVIRLIYEEKES